MAASAASLAYVQKMFLAYFGRPVAPTGQDYYAGLIDAGNVAALQDDFWNSTESQSKFGSLTTEGKITAIFQQLFGRDPALSGLTYWTTQINSGAVTLPAAALTILNSAAGDDLTVFNAKLKVAEAFTKELDTAAEVTGFQNNVAGAVSVLANIKTTTAADAAVADITNIVKGVVDGGTNVNQTFTLTVNQDTASASIFEAPIFTSTQTGGQIQTLTTVDKLTGVSTSDVLNAVLNATEAATKPTMTSVETVNVTSIAASVFDAANSTGITQIGSIDSSADLTVRNLSAGATVSVKNTAIAVDTQIQFVNSAVSGSSDSVSIKLDSVGRGATAGNAQILNVRGETTGSFETLNIESTGGASRFANIGSDSTVAVAAAPTAAGSGVKTINVTGSANLRVDGDLLNVTTVDASTFEGNLRVSLDATKNVVVTGGKGSDYFSFAAGLSNDDTVNGNDGRDTVAVTANTGLGDGNKVTNIEILRNDGAAVATIFDLAKVASFDAVVHNSGNTATYNNFVKTGAADSTKGLTILGIGNVTVAVKDANALGSNSDSLYVNVGATTSTAPFAAGTVTTAAVEKIVVDVKDAGANTATAGAQPYLTADASLGTVEFKGGSLGTAFNAGAIAGTGVGLTNIDASTFVGDLTVSGNAFSQVIKGGSGNDTLATGGRAAFALGTVADTFTGGSGNDSFSFADLTDGVLTEANITAIDATAAVAATNRGEIVTITDLNLGGANAGTRVDTIDFTGALLGGVAAGGFAIVNGGAVTALTGVDLGAALSTAIADAGVLGSAAAVAKAGLFTWAGDTYLIATSNTTAANAFGAVAGHDIIIKVTGMTGTLDVSDFV